MACRRRYPAFGGKTKDSARFEVFRRGNLGELYLKEGKLDLAKQQLARLDNICTFGCKEFDDLKAAIEVYADGSDFTGFSKQPQSAD